MGSIPEGDMGDRNLNSPSLFLRGAVIIGLVLHAIVFLVFRVISHPGSTIEFREPSLRIPIRAQDRVHPVIWEQSLLFDSAPLFMPTEWNVSARTDNLYEVERLTPLFSFFPAQISLTDSRLQPVPHTVAESDLPDSPRDLLTEGFWQLFRTLERGKLIPGKAVLRDGFVRVIDWQNHELRLHEPLELDLVENLGRPLWNPVEIAVDIDGANLVGQPLLLQGSGSQEIDEAITEAVTTPEFLGKLRSGYFKVEAGP